MTSDYLFLLFIIGSVLGFFVETIFCYFVRGEIVSRKGMVYGPFSQIYGFGALLMTLCLSPLAARNPVILFLGSAVLGGLFETLCSLFQESIFGTVSWNYSYQRGSLFGGRTSLTFMFFWGVLGSFYITFVHPFLFSLITKVPERMKLSVVCILFLLLAYDLVLSCFALQRWKERNGGIARMGRISSFFDEQFPDTRMEHIYPDMKFTLIKADG